MYTGLNSLGLNTAPFAVSPVAQLFQNGEPGAVFIAAKPTADWTTNPNLVTMYQDAAGTTPVTALEQQVGLQLDVKPIFLGPNLATNTWSTLAGNDNGTTSISATAFSQTAGTTLGRSYVVFPTVAGKSYTIAYKIDTISFGLAGIFARDGNTGGGTVINTATNLTAGSTGSITFTATSASTSALFSTQSTGAAMAASGIQIREVIAAPNAVGQPLRGANDWKDSSVFFDGPSSQVSPGVYRILSPDGSLSGVTQTLGGTSIVVGAWYEVTFNIDSVTTPGDGLRVGSTGPAIAATIGPKRVIFKADQNKPNVKRNTLACDIQVSNISYRQVYGNHRSQATAGARAVLSARYNKVTARNANPVDLSSIAKGGDAAATLTLVNDATALAAAGLDKVCTLGNVYKLDNSAGVANASATTAGQAGNTNLQQVSVWWRGTGQARVNTQSVAASLVALPAGYQKQSVNVAAGNAIDQWIIVAPAGSVVYFILMDMRDACYSYLPTPQVVWDATTGYDDTGFPARIKYSGAQGYATGSVDFSGGDEMQFFGGLSKLQDSITVAAFLETNDPNTNNGTFAFYAPVNLSGNNFAWRSKGDVMVTCTTPTTYPAPQANVWSGQAKISTDSMTLRMNGAQVAATATDQGSGNYSVTPIYYGSRGGAGASLPFTGDEFVSIVRGGSAPATGTIYSIEQWVGRQMSLNI